MGAIVLTTPTMSVHYKQTMQFICTKCDTTYTESPLRYQCDCGSPLSIHKHPPKQYLPDKNLLSLWRYRTSLPIPKNTSPITLNEGFTPIVPLNTSDPSHIVKLDYLCPTGSYKDRGASVLLTYLKALGVTEVVEDSSGNAGAAIAAYSARADIRCTIYCPESTSKSKLNQISTYGAELKLIPGNRMATTEAIKRAAENTCYASHNWHPVFLEGTKTVAYEIVEQFQYALPTHVICPVGFGSIYLGLYLGFKECHDENIIDPVPRLLGVQPDTCCPIYNAYSNETSTIARMSQTAPTLAEGITAELPIRDHKILEAIRYTNGAFTTVDDTDIKVGMKTLAEKGIYVEPTSAVVIKAYQKFQQAGIINSGDTVVSILTGSGLKASTQTPDSTQFFPHTGV